tara:strand:+ start:1193 stop:2092 length:900 start_codon:yes stop_codon:yes gene_type:complete
VVLRELQNQAGELLIQANSKATKRIIKDLEKLAKQETQWAAKLVESESNAELVSKTITTEQAVAVVESATFAPTPRSRVNLQSAFLELGRTASKRARQAISDGILTGMTNEEIAKSIFENSQLARNQARAIARTGTNLVSNNARQNLYQANSDVIEQYQWVATLDLRTTAVCSGRDGKLYNFGEGNPVPPAHYNCRSTTVPVVSEEFRSKPKKPPQRPAVGAKGVGTVSAKQNYGTWLRSQPASFQDEYFSKFKNGKDKAKLFRQGGLKIDKFIDPSGAEYSLSELQQLNPVEFAKSNI